MKNTGDEMIFPVYSVIFYVFAAILVFAAVLVITAKSPVKAALSLVVCFFASSVLWMLLQAEFLALVLIFVYVGAVMTLFLFVVMMLRTESRLVSSLHYLPLGALFFVVLLSVGWVVFSPAHWPAVLNTLTTHDSSYQNVVSIGVLLFTRYLLPFEIAAVLLLVGMVSAIVLVFHGKKTGTRTQKISEQLKATKQERLRMMDLR